MADPDVRRRLSESRRGMPSYVRTEDHKREMSEKLAGIAKPSLQGRSRPEHSILMRAWWTPERREAMRQRLLDPSSRYHGLSSRQRAEMCARSVMCANCGSDGRLLVHHLDGDKRNQSGDNLVVLCHPCHGKAHSGRKNRPSSET